MKFIGNLSKNDNHKNNNDKNGGDENGNYKSPAYRCTRSLRFGFGEMRQ